MLCLDVDHGFGLFRCPLTEAAATATSARVLFVVITADHENIAEESSNRVWRLLSVFLCLIGQRSESLTDLFLLLILFARLNFLLDLSLDELTLLA